MDVFSIAPALTVNESDFAMAVYSLSDLPQRFQEKIMPITESGCWFWMGKLSEKMYPQVIMSRPQRTCRAHRVVYEIVRGAIPEGLELDHVCRVKPCVNPAHLETVTGTENKRRYNATRTHCIRGHLLAGDNVRPNNGSTPRRYCVACGKVRYIAMLEKKTGMPVTREIIRHEMKTHCPKGHPYSGYNLVVIKGTNRRHCRQCGVDRVRARRLTKRQGSLNAI